MFNFSGHVRSCKDCPDRKLGCHGACKKYLKDSEELSKQKKEWIDNMEKYYKNRSKKGYRTTLYQSRFTYH